MDAIILAGGKPSPDLISATGCENRSELPLGGARIVDYVIRAIQAVDSDANMILVGATADGCTSVRAGNSFLESLYLGLESGSSETVLILTGDIPFVTPEAISDFIRECDKEAALNWPIVPVALCEERYPGVRRTKIRVREGVFTGGNIALIHREKFQRIFPEIERAYRNRKSPLRLAGQVGVGMLVRFLAGQLMPFTLPLAALVGGVSARVGEKVKAVISGHPELATDIDTLAHYETALQRFRGSDG